MKTELTTKLKIKVSSEDVDNLKSALKKIADEQKQIGFKKSSLTQDEADVIDKLSKEINK